MKKQVIIFVAVLFLTGLSMSSCSPKCHGGGWYGERNLGYVPIKEQPCDVHLKWEDESENCDTAEP